MAHIIDTDTADRTYLRLDNGLMQEAFGQNGRYAKQEPATIVSKDGREFGPGLKDEAAGDAYRNRSRIEIAYVTYDDAVDATEIIMGGAASAASKEWKGETTTAKFLERRFKADFAAVESSQILFDKLQADLDLSTVESRMESAPVGGSPRVGAFLAGSPMSMNRIVSPLTSDGPVKMFVDLTCSAGYSESDLRDRGIAVLALARMIQLLRPVELHVVSSLRVSATFAQGNRKRAEGAKLKDTETALAMQVSTAPFDITTAARALTDAFVARGLAYNIQRGMCGLKRGTDSGLHWSSIPMADLLDVDPTRDVVIGPAHLGERIGTKQSAVAWVQKQFTAWLGASGHSSAAQSMAEKWGHETKDGKQSNGHMGEKRKNRSRGY